MDLKTRLAQQKICESLGVPAEKVEHLEIILDAKARMVVRITTTLATNNAEELASALEGQHASVTVVPAPFRDFLGLRREVRETYSDESDKILNLIEKYTWE